MSADVFDLSYILSVYLYEKNEKKKNNGKIIRKITFFKTIKLRLTCTIFYI